MNPLKRLGFRLLAWFTVAPVILYVHIRDRRHRKAGLDVRVLDSMRRHLCGKRRARRAPNPATGTFIHRRAR